MLLALTALAGGATALASAGVHAKHHKRGSGGHKYGNTTTPIKHVIVIIGENHTFDNVLATYRPPAGQSVNNLLSEGIVTAAGGAGRNVHKAIQEQATDTSSYQLDPKDTGPYATLPQPNTTYVSTPCDGQNGNLPDKRFPSNLPNAPYQITKYVPYFDGHAEYSGTCEYNGAYVGDPIHRFYQMYQEVSNGTHDLWTWVHETSGDANGGAAPSPFGPQSTDQGALDMGYYNMARGDAPVLNFLARNYSMSDNYHQPVMGGTGANHVALGTGYAAYYQDAHGNPTAPPSGEIENPNPQPGTNNFYTQDGYGASGTTNGGSYSDCSNHSVAGVSAVWSYLDSLSYKVMNDCASNHYYLLNNYNPGYNANGTLDKTGFTVPPQVNWPTIGGELSQHGISWGYFGEGFNRGNPTPDYCGICDPMQYSAQIMTNPTLRAHTEHGLDDFRSDVANGILPAVTFLKPGNDDGHPGYSTLAAFEGFADQAITEVQDNPKLWKNTAIFVTFDEGGGYYDSGYIQPVSFFGDGTRVPMIVVSPYSKPGYVSHTYTDHVSILKFIEANWRLPTLSKLSLDNLPNPTAKKNNPYVPTNRPAIGNMMDFFNFNQAHAALAPARLPAVRGGQRAGPLVRIPNALR
ncbi:MAG TPA: alkaline phosphatase family protein [Solirubrobacteraceae bacterium]|nr:alkaline phosphatase family protein [Solirubrobacteraceae bacterium]